MGIASARQDSRPVVEPALCNTIAGQPMTCWCAVVRFTPVVSTERIVPWTPTHFIEIENRSFSVTNIW